MAIVSDLQAADASADKALAVMERQITNAHKQTYDNMKAAFADVYAKYEQGGVLTHEEMAKYNRLKSLKAEMTREIGAMYNEEAKKMRDALSGIYQNSYYQTAFAIEKEVQARLTYLPLDSARIKAAIENPISGLTLNESLAKNRQSIVAKINQEITRNLIRGSSYGNMAKAIKETLGGDLKKSIRVAQTEAHRVHNMARYESMKHADDVGVKMLKVWVSTLDGLTRGAHQSLDGREVPVNGDFQSPAGGFGPAPGMLGVAADDINCRCTFIIRPVGFKSDFRRVRGEGVVPYKNYTEWGEAHGIKVYTLTIKP